MTERQILEELLMAYYIATDNHSTERKFVSLYANPSLGDELSELTEETWDNIRSLVKKQYIRYMPCPYPKSCMCCGEITITDKGIDNIDAPEQT